ncbi:MAG: hypothetical protein ABJP34_08035 [Erythrobacter sp.]
MLTLSSGLLLLMSAQATDESPKSAEEAASETPIIVTGDAKEEPAGRVIAGSRIPQKPRYDEYQHNFRTRTGLGGLGPGSGMSPMSLQNPVMRSQISSCAADNEAIGAKAACLLLSAKNDINAGNTESGADIYRYLTSSDEFAAEERRVAGEELYRLGNQQNDNLMREEALIRLVASGSLPAEREQSAQRSLVTLALKRQDFDSAISRLEVVVEGNPADTQSLANLAVLLRQEKREGASERMGQAIKVREAQGGTVPEEWRTF